MRAAIKAASRVMGTQKSQSVSSTRVTGTGHEMKMTDFASDAKEKDTAVEKKHGGNLSVRSAKAL